MNIKVYTVGKIDQSDNVAIQEYAKRLSRYCKIKLVKFKKADDLIKKMPQGGLNILVHSTGVNPSSEGFSKKISLYGLEGCSDIHFILGVSPETQLSVSETLSLSPMTMSIGLQTLLLFEQIYRAYRIIHNHTYHK